MRKNYNQLLCGILAAVLMLLCFAGCAPQTPQETTQTTTTVPETTQAAVPEYTLPAEDPILTARREQVLAKMRQMQSVLWRVDSPITISKYGNSKGVDTDAADEVVTLQPGRIYQGIPYTHGSGSEEAFMDFLGTPDENGIYILTGVDSNDLSGQDELSVYVPRLGNDCADAVYWAWATISPTVTYNYTRTMTAQQGCLPVGDYAADFEKHVKTAFTCQINGKDKIYAAYACARPADALVTAPTNGHAMMVSGVHVVLTPDGKIDGENSYFTIIHQTSRYLFKEQTVYNEKLGQEVYPSGGLDDKFTFAELFEDSYLPVTIKELVDPAPIPEAYAEMSNKTPDMVTRFTGTVNSNYRISDVTITITDAQGATVQQCTCYGREQEMFAQELARFIWESESESLRGFLDLDVLQPGNYTFTYSCRVSTGQTFTLGSFTFEK